MAEQKEALKLKEYNNKNNGDNDNSHNVNALWLQYHTVYVWGYSCGA